MLDLRILPNFKLANEDGHGRPFEEFLKDVNVIMLTHSAEATNGPAPELLRSFVAEARGVVDVSVRGFEIRSHDAFCDPSCGPHVVFQGRELVTICDSGGVVRRLWRVESDVWFLITNATRKVLDAGPIAEVERLSMQFNLDVALSPRCAARAPPDVQHLGRSDTAA